MLNNLETIKQTTKEAIELLAQIQTDIDRMLKLGLFENNKTKRQIWDKIKQLLHNENNVLTQIDNVQSYLYGIIKELDKVKPTLKDDRYRKQRIDDFIASMKTQEYSFANKEELTREFIEETKTGLVDSVVKKLKGLFSKDGKDNSNNTSTLEEDDDFIVKPDPKYFAKEYKNETEVVADKEKEVVETNEGKKSKGK